MKKVIEYQLLMDAQWISKNGAADSYFEERINNYIKDGWQPLGGISVVCYNKIKSDPYDNDMIIKHLYQTLVKYED